MTSHKLAIIAALLTCCAVAIAAETDEQSPKKFVTEWVAAFNKNDPKHHLSFYDMDDRLVVIVSAGLRYDGYDAVKEAYNKDQESVRFYDSKAKDIKIRELGDVALVSLDHQFKVRALADDSHWQVHIRTTMVLHKLDGQWKIVQEHSSPIRGIERNVPIEE